MLQIVALLTAIKDCSVKKTTMTEPRGWVSASITRRPICCQAAYSPQPTPYQNACDYINCDWLLGCANGPQQQSAKRRLKTWEFKQSHESPAHPSAFHFPARPAWDPIALPKPNRGGCDLHCSDCNKSGRHSRQHLALSTYLQPAFALSSMIDLSALRLSP